MLPSCGHRLVWTRYWYDTSRPIGNRRALLLRVVCTATKRCTDYDPLLHLQQIYSKASPSGCGDRAVWLPVQPLNRECAILMWQFNDEFLNKDFPRYFRQIAGRSLGDIMPLGEDRRSQAS
jgi:hypothetical protein